ncbi:MAG: DUF3015 family protein [Myxococcales bacterium]|jgi:hypothetical protein|nr:DUF3015 family protein [Myxococcales bacterium]
MTRIGQGSALGVVAALVLATLTASAEGDGRATSGTSDAGTSAALPAIDGGTTDATPADAATTTDGASVVPLPEKPMVRARRRPKAHYGAAGCGLGSIIFGTKPGLLQVTAASTNTSGGQTFAITSGTQNCDSIDDHETLDAFVAQNREAFAKDVARGSGETIATLTAIAGCADPSAVGRKLKPSFAQIFPTPNARPEAIARRLRTILKADVALACENLPE